MKKAGLAIMLLAALNILQAKEINLETTGIDKSGKTEVSA